MAKQLHSDLTGKKWKLDRSENVDEYMKLCNVNFFFRKLGQTMGYSLEFVNEPDGVCKIIMSSTFKNETTVFKIGEEFDETDFLGKKYKTTFHEKEGFLLAVTRKPINPEDPAYDGTFLIKDNELVNTSTIVSVEPHCSSTRYMKAVDK